MTSFNDSHVSSETLLLVVEAAIAKVGGKRKHKLVVKGNDG